MGGGGAEAGGTKAVLRVGIKWEQMQRKMLPRSSERNGRIPGQGGNSRVNTVGSHCTAVSSYPTHRAAILQSVNGEREGRGVPHCRYESKWRKQKERRIIAVAYSATSTFGRNYRTSHKTHIRPRGEGERGGGGDRNKTDIWFLMTGMFYFFPLYLKLHAVASSFL